MYEVLFRGMILHLVVGKYGHIINTIYLMHMAFLKESWELVCSPQSHKFLHPSQTSVQDYLGGSHVLYMCVVHVAT